MATRYQHRIGVRAEICFDVTLDVRVPSPEELSQTVAQALRHASDQDTGFKLNALPGGMVYPDWNSVDADLDPGNVLDPSTIRTFDCTEVNSTQ